MKNLTCRTLWIAILVLSTFTQNLQSQILQSPTESVWIFDGSKPQVINQNPSYIGNYRCLDLHKKYHKKQLRKIAKERSGTLFLVGKLKSFPVQESILEIGGLKVYTDSVLCANRLIKSNLISDKPFILKVKYQAGFKREWNKKHIDISNQLELSELVYYKGQLSKEQSRIVESYLALKYSINITKNTEKLLRDYWAQDSTKYWTSRGDGTYDKEVMAIGRQDFMNWAQNQTYTADASSIGIGLENPLILGNQPGVKIEDGSMLIISKRLWGMQSITCGAANYDLPWKFKFFNWNTQADWLYLEWDSVLNLLNPPRFTDGVTDLALTYSEQNGITKVNIPIGDLPNLAHQTWYLVWDNSSLSCLPLGSFNLNRCHSSINSNNSLVIQLDEEALPSSYELRDVKTGDVISGEITQSSSILNQLPGGQFKLKVFNQKSDWINQVVKLSFCEGQTNESLSKVQFSEYSSLKLLEQDLPGSLNNKEQTFTNTNINLFPNPLEKGSSFTATFSPDLLDQNFEIQIFDQSGKLVHSENYTPRKETTYQRSLQSAGDYLIHFKGTTITEVKQIIVK